LKIHHKILDIWQNEFLQKQIVFKTLFGRLKGREIEGLKIKEERSENDEEL